MYSFIAFGHSHIVAIAKGLYEYQAQPSAPDRQAQGQFAYLYDDTYLPMLQGDADAPSLNPKLQQLLSEGAWNFVMLVCGGNEHNVLGIVKKKRPFDFVLRAEPDLPLQPGYELVPEALIREILATYMAETLQTMRAFRAATKLPMLQLEPPPPLPNARVLAYPSEFFRRTIFRKNIAPELLRYKLWRVQSEIYRRLCDEIGVSYVRAPAAMIDARGLLVEAGWGSDATHANARYGVEAVKDALEVYRAQFEREQTPS
ncbi:MAG: hypothetical protein NVSMB26_26230 [Beijerinckiaceae bacterium]